MWYTSLTPDQDGEPSAVPETAPQGEVELRYVAYCDILGFSNRILTDFDRTLELYSEFGRFMSELPIEGVQATIYSDAILITAASLDKLLSAVQSLWFVALTHDLMIRGGITMGRYWEKRVGNHFLVASDALVRAVKLERSVGAPAVEIADVVEIPDSFWFARFSHGPFKTPLLHFRDRNIVNPFNRLWFRSAAHRAERLMASSPAHKDKYLWFLALHKAVEQQEELIPLEVLRRFIGAGVLRPSPPDHAGESGPSTAGQVIRWVTPVSTPQKPPRWCPS